MGLALRVAGTDGVLSSRAGNLGVGQGHCFYDIVPFRELAENDLDNFLITFRDTHSTHRRLETGNAFKVKFGVLVPHELYTLQFRRKHAARLVEGGVPTLSSSSEHQKRGDTRKDNFRKGRRQLLYKYTPMSVCAPLQ